MTWCIVLSLPLHSTFMGSGSHFPFLIHVDELGPWSMRPKLQLKLILIPSITGMCCVYPMIFIESLVSGFDCCTGGRPQLATTDKLKLYCSCGKYNYDSMITESNAIKRMTESS